MRITSLLAETGHIVSNSQVEFEFVFANADCIGLNLDSDDPVEFVVTSKHLASTLSETLYLIDEYTITATKPRDITVDFYGAADSTVRALHSLRVKYELSSSQLKQGYILTFQLPISTYDFKKADKYADWSTVSEFVYENAKDQIKVMRDEVEVDS